jgi:hypothetical protein
VITAERILWAYVIDRACQYANDSPCRAAIEDVACLLLKGEHIEAYAHGELDDLLKRWL